MTSQATMALVTGATTGIGYEFCRLLGGEGYHLIIVARDSQRLEQRKEELERRFAITVHPIALDLSRPEAVDVLLAQIGSDVSRIEILINNAGFGKRGAFWEMDPLFQVQMIQVNVTALADLTRRLLPFMLKQGKGWILNVASTAAFSPGPYMAVYYATKAFVVSFSEALYEELKGTGITVSALCPGPTRTEFQHRAGLDSEKPFPLLPMMSAEAVARAGYRGLIRGRRIIIPGWLNKISVFSTRLLPREVTSRMIKWAQAKRTGNAL